MSISGRGSILTSSLLSSTGRIYVRVLVYVGSTAELSSYILSHSCRLFKFRDNLSLFVYLFQEGAKRCKRSLHHVLVRRGGRTIT